jgi:hypothetical protein
MQPANPSQFLGWHELNFALYLLCNTKLVSAFTMFINPGLNYYQLIVISG